MRSTCFRCNRPSALCLCDRIHAVENRIGVTILQHPRERRHPFGTARFAALGLTDTRVEVAWGGFDRNLARQIALPPRAALLYPSPNAIDVRELSPTERPSHLVVLDGTWSHAHRLYRDNPWLCELPHVKVVPDAPSRYRIRREPKPTCLSTIEAIITTLRHLEPETQGFDALLRAFDSMIDEQLTFIRQEPRSDRHKRPRTRPSRAVPRPLLDDYDSIVLVYGETTEVAMRRDPQVRELLQWTALRPSTGERFERLIRSDGPAPSDHHLSRIGLSKGSCDEAISPARFVEDWQPFVREDDVLAAWNQSTLSLLAQASGVQIEGIHLKAAYCNHRGGRCGTLESVLQREGLQPLAAEFSGRAARRLGNARAIAEFLRATSA